MKTQSSNLRTAEKSQQTQPAFLYHFDYAGTHYHFTNYDQDIVISGGPVGKMANPQTFLSAQIQHSRPDQNMEVNPSSVGVVLGAIDQEIRKYFLTASTKQIDLDIWRVNSASLPGPIAYSDLYMEFRGIADSIGFDDYTITAPFVSLMLHEDRPVPAIFYQRTCNHTLYDQTPGGCGVQSSLFSVTRSIDALDRVSKWVQLNILSMNIGSPTRSHTITTDSFQGGLLLDAFGNKVAITSNELVPAVGWKLYLQWWPYTLANGQTVTASLGCNRTVRICHETFQNRHRILSTPYVPNNNPTVDGITV